MTLFIVVTAFLLLVTCSAGGWMVMKLSRAMKSHGAELAQRLPELGKATRENYHSVTGRRHRNLTTDFFVRKGGRMERKERPS